MYSAEAIWHDGFKVFFKVIFYRRQPRTVFSHLQMAICNHLHPSTAGFRRPSSPVYSWLSSAIFTRLQLVICSPSREPSSAIFSSSRDPSSPIFSWQSWPVFSHLQPQPRAVFTHLQDCIFGANFENRSLAPSQWEESVGCREIYNREFKL